MSKKIKQSKLNVASFFSGAGGLDIGFHQAGYEIVFSSDIMKQAELTFNRNFPSVPFINKDISLFTKDEILNLAGEKKIDVVIGGPPCQGFSNMGNKNSADPRNYLFQSYRNVIKWLEPTSFLFENVKGIKTMFEGRFFEKVVNDFLSIGYNIHFSLLNSNNYGVPQKRERIIIYGSKISEPFLFPEHEKSSFGGLSSYTNVGDAIMDLVGKENNFPNHIPLNHGETVIRRYKLIPEGGKLPKPEDLPVEIRRKNFGNTYTRLDRSLPSSTIVPGNNALPVHPTLNRSMTPREAARIQTFPDTYIFEGDRKSQCIQVGNAVPPLMGAKLAIAVQNHIKGVKMKGEKPQGTITTGDTFKVNKKKKNGRANLKFADLFSGVGGFTEGFKSAGLECVLSADYNEYAVNAHRMNHPDDECWHTDLSIKSEREKVIKYLKKEKVNLIVGGPPCQGFSIFGKRRFVNTKNHDITSDNRNNLVHEFAEIVNRVSPDWFLMENVPGILSAHKGKYVEEICSFFNSNGYRTEAKIINAADYGAPQQRKRFILIGTKTDYIIPWPKAKFFNSPEDWQKPYRTVGQAISDLAHPETHLQYKNHVPPKHSKITADRFSYIEEGKKMDIEKLPKKLRIGQKTGKPIANFSHVFKRLDRNKPSGTIVPGHNAFPVHPTLNRTLTVREAARIQTFPDRYVFTGPIINQCLQVGNAFPPLVAQIFADRLRTIINKKWELSNTTHLAKYSMLD
jgi:DNA (cytosine-5)-methyltransferase 1